LAGIDRLVRRDAPYLAEVDHRFIDPVLAELRILSSLTEAGYVVRYPVKNGFQIP
jgi:hypothetical protein